MGNKNKCGLEVRGSGEWEEGMGNKNKSGLEVRERVVSRRKVWGIRTSVD